LIFGIFPFVFRYSCFVFLLYCTHNIPLDAQSGYIVGILFCLMKLQKSLVQLFRK
jgi:hypothetical protein